MSDELINTDPRLPEVPSAPHGGIHTGERLPEAKVELIRKLYAEGKSKNAIVKEVGTTWKIVDAVCDPERQVTSEQAERVRSLRASGMDFINIAETMELKIRTVRLIAQNDPAIVAKLQETRSSRALVLEAVSMEAAHRAVEERLRTGKLTVAEASNLTMIANGMVRDTIGAAPIRVKIEADEHVIAAMNLFGGGAPKLLPQKSEVIEAEVIPSPSKTTL